MTDFADNCPNCGHQWAYTHDSKTYSRIHGLVEHDVVVSWHCPKCEAWWPRGSTAILSRLADAINQQYLTEATP